MTFRKFLSLALVCSMLMASAQLMCGEVTQNTAETDKCAQALAKAEEAKLAAEKAKREAEYAEQKAQVAQRWNKNLSQAVVRCATAAAGVGLLIAAKTYGNLSSPSEGGSFLKFLTFLGGLTAGTTASLYSVIEPYPTVSWYDEHDTYLLNQTSKTLGAVGLAVSGAIAAIKLF